jgi:hypothetical protein
MTIGCYSSMFKKVCSICHECRLEMKMSPKENICRRCFSEKNQIKLYSSENNMNPGKLPPELCDMTIIEQQLISKITPCINVHLLKHGGIAFNGHCVTFPLISEYTGLFCLSQRSALWTLKRLTVNSFDVSYLPPFLTFNVLMFLRKKSNKTIFIRK